MKILKSHKELEVYQLAFRTSMEIFHISKSFPKDEIFSLTSQIRRSSRSVSAYIAEAFKKSLPVSLSPVLLSPRLPLRRS